MSAKSETGAQRAILISGAASGIGLATARLFAGKGWLVGALDRDETGLGRLSAELGNAVWTATVDVTDRAEVLAVVAGFGEVAGRLDVLHNNAGIDAKGPFAEMDWAVIERLVAINLLGGMSLVHAAIPLLAQTERALCLTTCSASSIFGQQNMAVYSATKFAVRGLTEALSVELAPHGVRAADLIPGIIDTGMLSEAEKAMLPNEGPLRVIPPSAVAEAAWAAWEGDRLHWFIPPELAALDLAARQDAEAVRDRRIAGSPV
ncbi:MAG: SDR family oxidoreductase [Novosphingobium sp.]